MLPARLPCYGEGMMYDGSDREARGASTSLFENLPASWVPRERFNGGRPRSCVAHIPSARSKTGDSVSAVFVKGGLYMDDRILKLCSCEVDRGMRYSPDRFERGWIIRQSGNDMPMDMGELIP